MEPRASLARYARSAPLGILLLCLHLPACGGESQVASAPPEAARTSIAGTYRVQGLTTVIGSDASRAISGTLIVAQEGEAYTATFDLQTDYPAPGGAVRADVIGTADGTIEGTALEGTARTQIVAARVPGLDPGFTLVPPSFGVRVVSTARGTVNDDGSIEFQLENRAAEGEEYTPTRTVVRGVRAPD